MKTTIVFDTHISGHNLEYIHHIYSEATTDTERKYIFAIPKEFKKVKDKLEWKDSDNIDFHFINEEELLPLFKNSWYKSFHNCRILRSIVKEYNADNVILVVLMQILPFLFLLPRKINVIGILYFIYLYKWNDMGVYEKIKEVLNFTCIKYSPNIRNVYVLNDEVSSRILNRIYKTKKFKWIVDPVPMLPKRDNTINRESLGIKQNAIVYLHFGSLSRRKGTLDILECVPYMKKENVYIFAGKIGDDIREIFYNKVGELEHKFNIIIIDEFCTFEKIASLCTLSNFLLLPYKEVYQSSGLIAYSSLFKIPTIATNKGMLGKLVRRYKLGYAIDFSNIEIACKTIQSIDVLDKNISKEYIETHTIERFSKKLIASL